MIELPIPGFSRYRIDNTGAITRIGGSKPGPCAVWISVNGYPMVTLTRDGGGKFSISVHRLVALAFHGAPPFPGALVRHLDGNKRNSVATNLAWGTSGENEADKARHGTLVYGERHHKSTLTEAKVRRAIELLEEGNPYTTIAAELGVTKDTVGALARGETWKHITGGVDRRNGTRFAYLGSRARWTQA